jgi:hypothetical protein
MLHELDHDALLSNALWGCARLRVQYSALSSKLRLFKDS